MIIPRYLSREVFHAVIVMVSTLLFLLVSNLLVRSLSQVASADSVFTHVVFNLIGVTLPKYIGIVLPISLFLSIILVYGRAFSDNELLVCQAGGMSWFRLLGITMLPASLIFVIVAILSLWIMPMMSAHQTMISQDIKQTNRISLVRPGRFVSFSGGKQVVYLGESSVADNSYSDIFIYRQLSNKSAPEIILAPTGYQQKDPQTGEDYFVFKNGYQYKAWPGSQSYQVVHFDEYAVHFAQNKKVLPTLDGLSNRELLTRGTPEAIAELQWRFVLPLSVFVMSIMGVALCYVKPRTGRYAKVLPGILVFILYYNAIVVARTWLEDAIVPSVIGIWWVPLLFAGVGIWMICVKEGCFQRMQVR